MRTLVIALIVFLISTSTCLAATKYVEIMVDTSASMNEQIEGKAKLDIAKGAVSSVLSEIPDDIALGLRMYGNSETGDVCKATKLLVSINKGTKSEISKLVNDFSTGSLTPIAYSLRQAANDFPAGGENYIILVSDGQETCGGDPIATIEELKRAGYKIIIHTVGFDVDEDTRAQLKAIASSSGGLYMDAKNAGELGSSLKTITEKIREYIPYKEEGEIQPGQGFGSATEVKMDKTYSHDIMAGEEHFYAVPVKKGQDIIVTVTMKRKEMGASDMIGRDATAFTFSASLYDSDRMLLAGGYDKKIYIEGDNTNPESLRLSGAMPFSGKAYITIGLNWEHAKSPYSSGGEEKFYAAREKSNHSADYTFKFRKAE